MCASWELRRYLNGSLRNVLPFFLEAAIRQTDRQAGGQTDWLAGWMTGCLGGGRGGGVVRLKVMPWLKFRSDDRRHGSRMRLCPRGKITIVFTRGHSCRCDVL